MHTSNTLAQYIAVVTDICLHWGNWTSHTHPWFRGQSDASWPLIPRLYRASSEHTNLERELVRDFRLRASAFLERQSGSNLELLFVMQHHGMPTRLLDWTESHLAALFFAVVDERVESDAAVWILGPAGLNESAGSDGPGNRVPMSTASIFDNYILSDLDANPVVRTVRAVVPLAVRPSRSTPRIVAQKGMFTIHGSDSTSLDERCAGPRNNGKLLDRIIVPAEHRKRMKKELLLAGVSYSSLFPDLDGLCREIQYRYSESYLRLQPLPNDR